MSYVSKRRLLAETPLKMVTKGGSLPMSIIKALAPIAMEGALPVARAVGERVARSISPTGSGYRLAGMGMKKGRYRKSSTRRRSMSGGKKRSSTRKRRSNRRRSTSGGMYRRRSSRSRSRSRSRSSSRGGRYKKRSSSYKKRR